MTRDEFLALSQQSPEAAWTAFDLLQQQVQTLAADFAALKARLDKDSHNSNLPPSSDGLKKKPTPNSLRTKSGRKPGGQRGHRGCTLHPASKPDTVVAHVPPTCTHCGTSLAEAQIVGEERRQVFDLPPLRLFVTEHRGQTRRCRCGACTSAAFPPEAREPIQYGPRVKALGVYLRDYQLLPFARIAQLFADLFEAPLSPGTLVGALKQGARTLAPVHEAIQQALRAAKIAHFDETGMRVGGRLHWLHSASTKTLTHYFCHARRGKVGSDAAGVLPHFLGRAVHDGWSSYARYACSHSLCNAHHLRELTPFAEAGEVWAADLKSLLVEMKTAVERARERGLKRLALMLECRLLARYCKLVAAGYAAHPPPEHPPRDKRGRPKQGPARSLLLRLDRQRASVLAFLSDFNVPFDNNLAERDVRMTKVRQKVSGGFRTQDGASDFCVMRGYISTLCKQKIHVLSALEQVFRGKPVYPCTETA